MAPEGTAIGDKLNNLTGGRMSWLMDGARKKHEGDGAVKEEAKEEGGKKDEDSKESTVPKAGAPDVQKHVNTAKDQATKNVNGGPKKLNRASGGVTSGVTNAAGGAKGAAGVATG